MSYARPLLGQERDHTYFYGDEKITEMEEDDRGGVIALQFRARRKELLYFFYLHRYR